MDSLNEISNEPVTALIVRTVKPGCIDEFEEWVQGMNQVPKKFAGFLGVSVIRPRDPAHPEFVIVVRFDEYEHLKAFMRSEEREQYLKKSEPLTVGEMTVQEMHGFESFFSLPGQISGNAAPPAKYKMAVLTILALYPPLLAISTLVAGIFRGLPRPLLILVTVVILVPLMTYFFMPWVTRLFRGWLYPTNRN